MLWAEEPSTLLHLRYQCFLPALATGFLGCSPRASLQAGKLLREVSGPCGKCLPLGKKAESSVSLEDDCRPWLGENLAQEMN